MSLSGEMQKDYRLQDKRQLDWVGDYTKDECTKCGRFRVLLCNNGKHRCEKCGWCPEEDKYIGV